MNCRTFTDGVSFLAHAGGFLERDEAVAGPMLGVAGMPEPALLATVDEDGGPRLAAARLPDRKLLVHGDAAAIGPLVTHLCDAGATLPSVIGPTAVSQAFAGAWSAAAACGFAFQMGLGVYELREVRFAGDAAGALRVAGPEDVDLLAEWMFRFTRDAGVDLDETPETIRRGVAGKVGRGHLFLWEDGGEPVSAAGLARPTRHGITVNAVFTPRAWRGRGYATACVAALSRHALEGGRAFCTLLTDLANPTSNRIYRRIGYEPVGELAEYDFGHGDG